mmetsp:Transcript_56145/g.146029  ORF Transcript_56145/g.146029 Transcript_56145/m.146029 type:complete len:212 (-) Transcript_56145:701-1336(-)
MTSRSSCCFRAFMLSVSSPKSAPTSASSLNRPIAVWNGFVRTLTVCSADSSDRREGDRPHGASDPAPALKAVGSTTTFISESTGLAMEKVITLEPPSAPISHEKGTMRGTKWTAALFFWNGGFEHGLICGFTTMPLQGVASRNRPAPSPTSPLLLRRHRRDLFVSSAFRTGRSAQVWSCCSGASSCVRPGYGLPWMGSPRAASGPRCARSW